MSVDVQSDSYPLITVLHANIANHSTKFQFRSIHCFHGNVNIRFTQRFAISQQPVYGLFFYLTFFDFRTLRLVRTQCRCHCPCRKRCVVSCHKRTSQRLCLYWGELVHVLILSFPYAQPSRFLRFGSAYHCERTRSDGICSCIDRSGCPPNQSTNGIWVLSTSVVAVRLTAESRHVR